MLLKVEQSTTLSSTQLSRHDIIDHREIRRFLGGREFNELRLMDTVIPTSKSDNLQDVFETRSLLCTRSVFGPSGRLGKLQIPTVCVRQSHLIRRATICFENRRGRDQDTNAFGA